MGITYQFGKFSVDSVNQTLSQNGTRTTLRPKQFAVLEYLLKNAGRLVLKDELLDAAWPDVAVGDGVLKVCIAELRRLLDDNASPPAYIETVHRRGYKFVAGVNVQERAETVPAGTPQRGPEKPDDSGSPGPAVHESPPATVGAPSISSQSTASLRHEWRSVLIASIAVLLTAVIAWWFMPPPVPRVTGSTQITHDGKELCCLVTDGSRIYFNQLLSIDHDLVLQVPISGGQTKEIPSGFRNTRILDIAPDHAQLLIASIGADVTTSSHWTLPTAGGAARRLGDMMGDASTDARWSPDGQRLVFCKRSELWISNRDGGGAYRIAAVKGFPRAPVFSPDGKRIRFTLVDLEAHTFSLWEIKPDGSNLHALLPGWQESPEECCGIWTHDGRYFLFRNFTRTEGFGDVFALRETHSFLHRSPKPVQLTFGPTHFEIGTTTPDDKRLLVSGFDPRGELVRYDQSTKQFVPFLGGIAAIDVAFSQDRQHIAYVSLVDDTLWTSRTDGSERIQLTFAPEHAALPRWSPDGSRIAYMRAELGKPWKACIISAQGGIGEQLIPGNSTESDPVWSPDGSRIAFATGTPEGSKSSSIGILDTRTHQVSILPGSEGRFSPRWSPDGRYLAALDFAQNSTQLFLYDFRASLWSRWVSDPGGIAYPAWSADSQLMEYMNPQKCRRVKLGNTQPEDVFALGAFSPYFGDLGPWNDTAPDGSRMFTRDTSTNDIYALDLDLP